MTSGPANLAPTPIGRLLCIVRRLMFYGEHLAVSLQQQAGTRHFPVLVRPFGTLNLALILARIACGLRRAAALEERLVRRVMSGRGLTPTPLRVYVPRGPGNPRPPAAPRASQSRDPLLAALPTAEEIAEDVRRRPIGAVLVDICRDLGLRPGDVDGAFWRELSLAITVYGGSMTAYFNEMISWISCTPDVLPDEDASGAAAASLAEPCAATLDQGASSGTTAQLPERHAAASGADTSSGTVAPLPEPRAPVPVAHDATGPPEDLAEALAA